MLSVGIVGWRGMVGSVLMDRLLGEGDLDGVAPLFFSTTQAGRPGPRIGGEASLVQDAEDVERLADMDIIISCQGGSYTEAMHPRLRDHGWLAFRF